MTCPNWSIARYEYIHCPATLTALGRGRQRRPPGPAETAGFGPAAALSPQRPHPGCRRGRSVVCLDQPNSPGKELMAGRHSKRGAHIIRRRANQRKR